MKRLRTGLIRQGPELYSLQSNPLLKPLRRASEDYEQPALLMRKLKPKEVKKLDQGFIAEPELEPKPSTPMSSEMASSVLSTGAGSFPKEDPGLCPRFLPQIPQALCSLLLHATLPTSTPMLQPQNRVETAERSCKSLSCLTTELKEEGDGNRSQTPISLVRARLSLRLSRDRKVGQFGICHGYFRHPHLYYCFADSQVGCSQSLPTG